MADVVVRLEVLLPFIDSPDFERLPWDERKLIRRQAEAMVEYRRALCDRLEMLEAIGAGGGDIA